MYQSLLNGWSQSNLEIFINEPANSSLKHGHTWGRKLIHRTLHRPLECAFSFPLHTSGPRLHLLTNQLLSTVQSSFMIYLQPTLNFHSYLHITDSCLYQLTCRYYENNISDPPIYCAHHSTVLCTLLKHQFSWNIAQSHLR